MISPFQLAAATLVGFVMTAASTVVIPSNKPFMRVNDISYKDGMVFGDRTVYPLGDINVRVADWRVTVVPIGQNSPACQTKPGPDIQQGWSSYKAGELDSEMSLDAWVGDEGCLARMGDGEHVMFMNWTARDGGKPETHAIKFYK